MKIMRDPGAPTQAQIDAHNINHLPFRAWCPACVTGTAKDRPHHRDDGESKEVATMVFDYGFLGSEATTPGNETYSDRNAMCKCSAEKRFNEYVRG